MCLNIFDILKIGGIKNFYCFLENGQTISQDTKIAAPFLPIGANTTWINGAMPVFKTYMTILPSSHQT